MGYIIRLIAVLPVLSVGVSAILFFVFAFEVHPVFGILSALLSLTTIILFFFYEETVKEIVELLQIILNKTPIYIKNGITNK